jgi:hypothetical protein
MRQMILADKITLVEGHGSANAYVFYTPAIPSLCIPAVGLEDGPGGVADGMTGVTELPAGVSLAATWDPALARQYGSVIGAEENGKGASANLGPTVNIDRDPRWGRSFESLSEDPYLNSTLDVPEIDGIQRQDVEDQVKHYDAYNQETYRNTPADDVVVSDRALHEIYLPSFYSAVTAGHAASVMCAYSSISGDTSQLLWATPADLAPGISAAVAAAKSASTAVVVVSDDTESEATDRPGLSLPSAQDELISAVAAANPHTVVVIDAGAPVAMPWLSQVAAVVDAWYPGQASGTALASVLFGQTDPAGHLPVSFPTSLAQVPASSPSEFPGNGSEVLYSEGVDVGYRWYDAKDETPLFPFGYGLSYTTFAFSGLRISRASVNGTSDVRVSAVITNTGSRAGRDVAQLYVGDPGSTGEPPRQLGGFTRVTLAPGQSAPVAFTLSPQQLSWWGSTGWTESTGTYRVYVGDSSAPANLPLRGSFAVTATPGARQVAVTAPSAVTAGKAFTARVTLTAGGNQTLHGVRLAVQLPQGWRLVPTSRSAFGTVRAGQAVAATFRVTPPASSPTVSAVVHATATMGAATRENGVSVTVG